jgi:MFS family permease
MRGGLFFGWWVVMASAVGLATGIASINLFSFGVFQQPLMQEFGWTRTEVSLVLAVGTLVTFFTSPFVGSLIDAHGARRVALPSIAALGLALISLYWLTPNLWHFYLVFALLPIIGAGTSSVSYARVVTRWFERRRGAALGLALTGVGLGGAIIPRLSQWLIAEFGWRIGYAGLGLVCLLVTLPISFVLLRDSPQERGLLPDGDLAPPQHSTAAALVGATRAEALRSRVFWMMLAAFLVLGAAIGGVMLQFVPILVAHGVGAGEAAAMASGIGVSIVVGRVLAGWLLDRFFAPWVAIAFLIGPVVGVALLAGGASGSTALAAGALLGLAAGAEVDVIAYLVGRYFGTRSYAELYGYQYAVWTLGSGFAPVVTAAVYDRTGDYDPALWAYVVCLVLAALLLSLLGRYPRPDAADRLTPGGQARES